MADGIRKPRKDIGYRLAGWLLPIPTWVALIFIDHGKVAAYMETHLWLMCFFPLLLIFLVLFVRGYYLQYKR